MTKIVFAEQDPQIAEIISKSFGEREIKEYQEGLSYGAHETRDGVSLSLQSKMLPLVSPTDIQSLKKNQAFIKLPRNMPISRIKLPLLNH
jgi:type IV secretory pathway TraG/TraD family ATPase VirD4